MCITQENSLSSFKYEDSILKVRVLSNEHILKQLFIGNNKVVMFDDSRKVYFLGESKSLIHANPNVNKWTKTQTMFICFFFPSYPIHLFSQDFSPNLHSIYTLSFLLHFFTTLSLLSPTKGFFSFLLFITFFYTKSFNIFSFFSLFYINSNKKKH